MTDCSSDSDSLSSLSDSECSDSENRNKQNLTNVESDIPLSTNATAGTFGGASSFFNSRQERPKKRVKRSKPTFASLKPPQLHEAKEILKQVPDNHEKQKSRLLLNYSKNRTFDDWWWQLQEHFNILLYGVGSKKHIMEYFAHRLIEHYTRTSSAAETAPAIIFSHGYAQSFSLKEFVETIARNYIGLESFPTGITSNYAKCKYIKEICDNPPLRMLHNSDNEHMFISRDLYIFFHSIDGETVRFSETQDMLSVLAQSRRIHFIASTNHLNAHLMWDAEQQDRFNWIWTDVTSFISLGAEMTDRIKSVTAAASSVGAFYVLKSLTPTHVEVIQLLAKHHLNAVKKGKSKSGPNSDDDDDDENEKDTSIEFHDLLKLYEDTFTVMPEEKLRQLLNEFRDHKFIRQIKDAANGKEKLQMMLPLEVIRDEIMTYKP